MDFADGLHIMANPIGRRRIVSGDVIEHDGDWYRVDLKVQGDCCAVTVTLLIDEAFPERHALTVENDPDYIDEAFFDCVSEIETNSSKGHRREKAMRERHSDIDALELAYARSRF